MKKVFCIMLSVVMLTGCATTMGTSQTERDTAFQYGWQVFGEGGDFGVILVPSRGAMADATFIMQSKTRGPSTFARQLAQSLSKGAVEDTKIVVYGVNSAKTAQVIKDAISLISRQLTYLEILYVGELKYDDQLRRITEQKGATYYSIDVTD